MPSTVRKRQHAEIDDQTNLSTLETQQPAQPRSLLDQIRSNWEFANIGEFIFLFGDALKLDKELEIDVLEEECLRPQSGKLAELALSLLKHISSHRGLTLDLLDEYTRRQYVAKAPQRNPFGEEEEPKRFTDFDIFRKLKVLRQLTLWTFWNPDRIREKMPQKTEREQGEWRMEPLGWDSEDRSIIVLDDDRLYRWTDAPPPAPSPSRTPKAMSKKRSTKSSRTSKRRKVASGNAVEEGEDLNQEDETGISEKVPETQEPEEDGLGGAKWECIAITLADYRSYLDSIRRSRDPDEKALHARIVEEVLPQIEKKAEAQERKALRRQKELENLEKMQFAKRSSRIAGKAEKDKAQHEAEEAERKRREDLAMAKREQERQRKMEEARESRMLTREQRIRDRDMRRILHEEELAKLEASSQNDSGNESGRISERHRKAELEKRQRVLEELKQEDEEDWYFDCSICGVHGHNLDDGTHIIACEKCNVWQHSACHGIAEGDAERDDFHFTCATCQKPPKPKTTSIKLKVSPNGTSRPVDEDTPTKSKKGRGRTAGSKVGEQGDGSTIVVENGTPIKVKRGRGRPRKIRPGEEGETLNGLVTPSSKKHVNGYAGDGMITGTSSGKQKKASATEVGDEEDGYFYVPAAHGQLLNWQTGISPSSRSHAEEDRHWPSSKADVVKSPGRFNPEFNNFERQQHRSSPSAVRRTPALQSPVLSSAKGSGNDSRPVSRDQAMPQAVQASTPKQQSTAFATKSFANSPTPSLSATQGNTDIRFSPSRPGGSPGNSSYKVTTNAASIPVLGSGALSSPTLPPPGGMTFPSSLTNEASSLSSANGPGMAVENGDAGDAVTASSLAGRSPTKHDMPSTPQSFNNNISSFSFTAAARSFEAVSSQPAANGVSLANEASSLNKAPAPVLSPSPGAEKRVLEPPTKKDPPGVSCSASPYADRVMGSDDAQAVAASGLGLGLGIGIDVGGIATDTAEVVKVNGSVGEGHAETREVDMEDAED